MAAQNYKMLHIRIWPKDFFQTLLHGKKHQVVENHLIEVFLKIHF